MEINKQYYIKLLVIDGVVQPQDTCILLKLFDDGTCAVRNTDGEVRLFRQDMLSENPNEIYMELKSEKNNSVCK